MIILRVAFVAAAAALTALILQAMSADGRSLGAVLSAMFREPWVVVTLTDLYLGFFISATIILLAERRLWVGLCWALPIFVLGNVWTGIWLALRLPSLRARLARD
jgi:hypothetical protein